MFNTEEIYYLNRALDGKYIYGIKPKNIEINNINSVNETKNKLIERKILNEDSSINDISFLIIKNLEQYKNAEKYLWINDIVFSMDSSDYMIYFKKSNENEFEFKKSTKDLVFCSILKDYEFLWKNEITELKKEEIVVEDFIKYKLIDKSNKDILFIKRETKGKPDYYNIYYNDDGKTYKYDAIGQILYTMNEKNIRDEILEILNIEVNN